MISIKNIAETLALAGMCAATLVSPRHDGIGRSTVIHDVTGYNTHINLEELIVEFSRPYFSLEHPRSLLPVEDTMIEITSPSKGEIWFANQKYEIKWKIRNFFERTRTSIVLHYHLQESEYSESIASLEEIIPSLDFLGVKNKLYSWQMPLKELPWNTKLTIEINVFGQDGRLITRQESEPFLYLGKHARIVLNEPQKFYRYEGNECIGEWLCSGSTKKSGSYDLGINYAMIPRDKKGRIMTSVPYTDGSLMHWFIKIVPTDPERYRLRENITRFNGIHQAYPQRERRIGQPQSHGCINISKEYAKGNFEWTHDGMPIFVSKEKDDFSELLEKHKKLVFQEQNQNSDSKS